MKRKLAGETFTKWRFAWMYAPDLLENWLSKMAAEGNNLVCISKVWPAFTFEKRYTQIGFLCARLSMEDESRVCGNS